METAFDLAILRANTARFISLDPTPLILTPRAETFVAGTRKRVPGLPRPEQIFKVIWTDFGAGFQPLIAGGETRRFNFVLVGNWDAQIAIGDFWTDGGQDNEISYIYPHNGYEIKAGGISHGAHPNG